MTSLNSLIQELCPNGVKKIKMGHLITFQNIKNKGQYKRVYSVSSTAGFIDQSEYFSTGKTVASEDTSNYNVVKKGFFAYNPSRLNIGSIALLKTDDIGVVSPMYKVFSCDNEKILPEYMYLFVKSNYFAFEIEKRVESGARYRVDPEKFREIDVRIPPLSIQYEIIRIMDIFTALRTELNNELSARKKQYEYYRDTLLSCGDNVPVVPLIEIYDSSSGLSKSADEFGFGSPFLSFRTVFNSPTVPNELYDLVNTTKSEQSRYSIKKGDVFVTRTSETLEELGMSCAALRDYPKATFNGFTKRLRPKENAGIDPQYAAFFFRSSLFRAQIGRMAVLSTRVSLNDGILLRPVNYIFYIKNDSFIPVSIIDYELEEKYKETGGNSNEKITNYTELEEIFPIYIESHEAKKVTVKISTLVDRQINIPLYERLGSGFHSSDDIKAILESENLDIFGNNTKNKKRKEEYWFPIYYISFTTSKGNQFKLEFSVKDTL